MSANSTQVGGSHYKSRVQHWDFTTVNNHRYLEGCATKYVTRWRTKHKYPKVLRAVARAFGVHLPTPKEDLAKSVHYIDKMIELVEDGMLKPRKRDQHDIPVARFCQENNLSHEETFIIQMINDWQNTGHLRVARDAVKAILKS